MRSACRGFRGLQHKGFSLIEIMIVVVIVGILASIALPSYRDNVRASRRADVQRQLVERSQTLERYFTANGRYVTVAGGNACGGGADPTNDFYAVATVCTDTTFTITATPGGSGLQAADGTQTLTQSGARGGSVNNGSWKF